jgi:hypothetical protein
MFLGTVGIMGYTHDEFNFADTSWMPDSADLTTSLVADDPPLVPDNPDSLDPGGKLPLSNQGRPEDTRLVETVMFLLVFSFLEDVVGEQFLHILSGRTLSSGRHKLFSTEKEEQAVFYRKAKISFFRPSTEHMSSRPPAFGALISVAELLTSRGHLRSFAEIKHYLIVLAGVSYPLPPHLPLSSYAVLSRERPLSPHTH